MNLELWSLVWVIIVACVILALLYYVIKSYR